MNSNRGVGVVVLVCLGVFVCTLDTTVMNIILPSIQDQLNMSLNSVSWVLNVYTLCIAVMSIPMARLSDVFGRGRLFVIGLALFGLGSTLCGLSGAGSFLIFSRFVQSVGAAILIPCSNILGVEAMPLEKRNVSLALLGMTQGVAAAFGPTIGGLITQLTSWRDVFFVNVPICLVAIVFSWFLLSLRRPDVHRVDVDIVGLVLCTVSIFSLTYLLLEGNNWGWFSTKAISFAGTFMVCLTAFLLVERKVTAPMVNLSLFQNRLFTGASITVVTSTLFLVGVTVILPQFLTRVQGYSELTASLLVSPLPLAIFVSTPFISRLAVKIGPAIPVSCGFVLMGTGYVWLHDVIRENNPVTWSMILALAVVGCGFGFVIAPSQVASALAFEGTMLTTAQSVYGMFRQVGIVLSVAVFVGSLTHSLDAANKQNIGFARQAVREIRLPSNVQDVILASTTGQLVSEREYSRTAPSTENTQVIPNMPGILEYKNRVAARVKTNAEEAFAGIYKTSVPFVFVAALSAFLYRRSRETHHAESDDSVKNLEMTGP